MVLYGHSFSSLLCPFPSFCIFRLSNLFTGDARWFHQPRTTLYRTLYGVLVGLTPLSSDPINRRKSGMTGSRRSRLRIQGPEFREVEAKVSVSLLYGSPFVSTAHVIRRGLPFFTSDSPEPGP